MPANVVGIGEILWDLLPSGRQLGGAPANFAYHAGALGAQAGVISRVGNDALGLEVLDRLHRLGLSTSAVELDFLKPTGTVDVEVGASGQPRFTIREDVAWDHLMVSAASSSLVERADAVCFGSLAQRCEPSRATIQRLLAQCRPASLRVFDVNLRQHFYTRPVIEESLRLANVLKLNDAELPILAEMLQLRHSRPQDQLSEIMQRYALRAAALTRGGEGSLIGVEGGWSDHLGLPTDVQDTVGAGDSFTAAFVLGLLKNWPLDRINQRANEVARHVCGRVGATPPLPPELVADFAH